MSKKNINMMFTMNIIIAMVLFLAFTIGLNIGLHGLISLEVKAKPVQLVTFNNNEIIRTTALSSNNEIPVVLDNNKLDRIDKPSEITPHKDESSNLNGKLNVDSNNLNINLKKPTVNSKEIDHSDNKVISNINIKNENVDITSNKVINNVENVINGILNSQDYVSILKENYNLLESNKLSKSNSITTYISKNNKIPILLMTCNRPELLSETLKSLFLVRGINKDNIIVSQDGNNKEVSDVVKSNQITLIQNTGGLNLRGGAVSDGASRIALHYKFSLTNAFKHFPSAPCIIIIEDDLLFSPDFYEYFTTNANILELDDSLFLVSAWNDNGFIDKVKNPYFLHRTEFFPGLGWLLPRQLYEKELERNWPSTHWDHWLRSSSVHKGREIVYPQIPRSFHNGIKGTFMNMETHNRYFRDIDYNKDNSITWNNHYHDNNNIPYTTNVLKKVYDARITLFTSNCKHITNIKDLIGVEGIDSSQNNTFFLSLSLGEILCLWINVNPDAVPSEFEPISRFFGIWHEHKRGSHRGLHEFYWKNNYILLLNVFDILNIESFRHLRPDNVGLLQPSTFDMKLLALSKKPLFDIIPSDQVGLSCDKVCRQNNKTCKKDLFMYINGCDDLKKHFPCNQCSTSFGLEQPAYVNPRASSNPGQCLISSDISQTDCSSSHQMTMRLCPCV